MNFLLVMVLTLAPTQTLSDLHARARTYDRSTFRYVPPAPDRLERMRHLVAKLSREVAPGEPPETLRTEARALGLELGAAHDAAGELWVLHEPEGRREGSGLYAFRAGGAPLCVQAPHIFFDEGTGDIALDLFVRLRAACLATNTVHRYSPSAAGDGRVDVAHAEGTLFLAATEGLLEGARWPLVQLHGFGPKDELPPDVAAVVSDGVKSRGPDAPAVRLRAALARAWASERVLLFGDDARILGATTNIEGARARKAGVPFLHLEMSAATRERLRTSGAAPLATALREALALP